MKKKTEEVTIKYTWKFWCLVVLTISVIVGYILLFGLSIKAIVQDVQMSTYKHKVDGTVTVAEFYGKTWVSNGSDSGSSSKFKYMHFVIQFDKEIAGYGKYEYSASDMIATEKYLGDRYVVLFNKNISKAKIIQKDDIFTDNVILGVCIILTMLIYFFRKKIYTWFIKLDEKSDMYIVLKV